MMWWKKRFIHNGSLFLICFSAFITACAPAPVRTPPPPPPSETRPASVSPTSTSVAFTLTPSSTATHVPVGTITVTLAPTFTPIPPSPTGTPDLSSTRTVEELLEKSQPVVLQSSASPDGKWRAEVIRYDCARFGGGEEHAYEILQLILLEDRTETALATQLQTCGGVGAGGLGIAFWSPNGRRLYTTSAREGVPDGCSGSWWRPLTAYDVEQGTQVPLVWGPLSPDKKTLASPGKNEIVLWDLNDGEVGRLPGLHPGWLYGDIAWSPGGEALIYLQNEEACYEGLSAVVRIDLSDRTPTTLLEAVAPGFMGVEWDAPNRLRLLDANGREWAVNLEAK